VYPDINPCAGARRAVGWSAPAKAGVERGMPGERVQRQVDRLLNEAESALAQRDWIAAAWGRMSHSAGTPLAFWVASEKGDSEHLGLSSARVVRSRAVVSFAGIYDLSRPWPEDSWCHTRVPAVLGGSAAVVPDRYAAVSPRDLLPLGVPQLVIHGTVDGTTPIGESSAYVEEARAAAGPT